MTTPTKPKRGDRVVARVYNDANEVQVERTVKVLEDSTAFGTGLLLDLPGYRNVAAYPDNRAARDRKWPLRYVG